MKKIRIAQVGTNSMTHGAQTLDSILKHDDLYEFVGIAEPVGEWKSNLYQVLYSPSCDNLHEHEIRYEDGTSAVPEPRELTGYPSLVLSKPTCWQDELAQDYPDYQVLLQLEEDDDINLRFYDCGTLFFLIKPEDLQACNFNRVKCVLYSY